MLYLTNFEIQNKNILFLRNCAQKLRKFSILVAIALAAIGLLAILSQCTQFKPFVNLLKPLNWKSGLVLTFTSLAGALVLSFPDLLKSSSRSKRSKRLRSKLPSSLKDPVKSPNPPAVTRNGTEDPKTRLKRRRKNSPLERSPPESEEKFINKTMNRERRQRNREIYQFHDQLHSSCQKRFRCRNATFTDDQGDWFLPRSILSNPDASRCSLHTEREENPQCRGLLSLYGIEAPGAESRPFYPAVWVGDQGHHNILTQGPLPQHLNEFWGMVWDADLGGVVQATEPTELISGNEKEKAADYLPREDRPLEYQDFIVSLVSMERVGTAETIGSIEVRTLKVEKKGGEERQIKHVFIRKWADCTGFQDNQEEFFHNMKALLQGPGAFLLEESAAYHCASGLGRGPSAYSMVRLARQYKRAIKANETFDFNIITYIRELRKQRAGAIQVTAQGWMIKEWVETLVEGR